MNSYRVSGTPSKYDKVGVIKVGPATARNVLVLEPGSLRRRLVLCAVGQVDRGPRSRLAGVGGPASREPARRAVGAEPVQGEAGQQHPPVQLLPRGGWPTARSAEHHFQFIPNSSVEFAKRWGMSVAVHDLRRVIQAANWGGRVVLGGHSLGGSVITAYATWDFRGHAGADLDGLVYIDGGSGPAESAQAARQTLKALNSPKVTPWLTFGGIPAPFAGLFNATGAMGVLRAPDAPSLGQKFPLLPKDLKPSVPVTNEGQYGYALDAATSPPSLLAAQARLGRGISSRTINGYHTWNSAGDIPPDVTSQSRVAHRTASCVLTRCGIMLTPTALLGNASIHEPALLNLKADAVHVPSTIYIPFSSSSSGFASPTMALGSPSNRCRKCWGDGLQPRWFPSGRARLPRRCQPFSKCPRN